MRIATLFQFSDQHNYNNSELGQYDFYTHMIQSQTGGCVQVKRSLPGPSRGKPGPGG